MLQNEMKPAAVVASADIQPEVDGLVYIPMLDSYAATERVKMTGLSERDLKVALKWQSSNVDSMLHTFRLKVADAQRVYVVEEATRNNPKPVDQLARFDTYFHEFRRTARSDVLEYGASSNTDSLVARWSQDKRVDFGGVINHIFLKTMGQKALQLLLLKAVSGIEYHLVHPHGQVQAMAALVIKDFEVAEAGIRAFENWGHKDGIVILENSKMSASWLDEYRLNTISYLKEL